MSNEMVTLVDVSKSQVARKFNLNDRHVFEFSSLRMSDLIRVHKSTDALLPTDQVETHQRVAVRINDNYFVWSPEFEEMVGVPLEMIEKQKNRISNLEIRLHKQIKENAEQWIELQSECEEVERLKDVIDKLEDSLQKWKASWFAAMMLSVIASGAIIFGT